MALRLVETEEIPQRGLYITPPEPLYPDDENNLHSRKRTYYYDGRVLLIHGVEKGKHRAPPLWHKTATLTVDTDREVVAAVIASYIDARKKFGFPNDKAGKETMRAIRSRAIRAATISTGISSGQFAEIKANRGRIEPLEIAIDDTSQSGRHLYYYPDAESYDPKQLRDQLLAGFPTNDVLQTTIESPFWKITFDGRVLMDARMVSITSKYRLVAPITGIVRAASTVTGITDRDMSRVNHRFNNTIAVFPTVRQAR